MSDNRTTELRAKLTEQGVKWWPMCNNGYYEERDTEFVANGKKHTAHEWGDGLAVYNLTPEQAIAATLDDGEYEAKMDALLSRLTNGKFSKSRAYDLDFMESCVNEEFEDLYAKELADATLGSVPDEAELTQTYDAGFRNGVMAVFQQLEGVEDYEGLQDLIAEYWGEGEGNDER